MTSDYRVDGAVIFFVKIFYDAIALTNRSRETTIHT